MYGEFTSYNGQIRENVGLERFHCIGEHNHSLYAIRHFHKQCKSIRSSVIVQFVCCGGAVLDRNQTSVRINVEDVTGRRIRNNGVGAIGEGSGISVTGRHLVRNKTGRTSK